MINKSLILHIQGQRNGTAFVIKGQDTVADKEAFDNLAVNA